jgi:hypothetical protein
LLDLRELNEARPLLEEALAGQLRALEERDFFTTRYAFKLYELRLRAVILRARKPFAPSCCSGCSTRRCLRSWVSFARYATG